MNEHPHSTQKSQLPLTVENHRRQTLWQIWVPLGVAVIIFFALAVWASVATAQNSVTGTHFADISAIFLIVPAGLFGLVILLLLGAIIYGLSRLLGVFPIFSLRVRAAVYNVEAMILSILDKVVQPFLSIDSAWSGFVNLFAHFRSSKTKENPVH
jgi:hypothetical protein